MNVLSERQKLILSLIVHEYTRTAQPVGSNAMLEQFNLSMSSATIRNEMAQLTEMGYLRQPYTSAGRVPTEEGYRFFVSNLTQQATLPTATMRMISHQFYQSRQDLDQWLRLAASVLAKQSQGASLVTAPHSDKTQLKHLELIATRGNQVLMVLVLVGGEIRQQFFSLSEHFDQEHLSALATAISMGCHNCSADQLSLQLDGLDEIGLQILDLVRNEMRQAERLLTGEVYLDGLTNVLAEPEFSEPDGARSALKIFEERTLLNDLLERTILTNNEGGIQVVIGGEGTWEDLRECSVILARYGLLGNMTGTVGVLGPMRMPYSHTISTVRFIADLLSDKVAEMLVD